MIYGWGEAPSSTWEMTAYINTSTWAVTYGSDVTALWLSAWSPLWDEYFWQEPWYLTNGWGTFTPIANRNLSWLATASSGSDVMIRFPRRWISISKSWTTITIKLTNKPDDTANYNYRAFSRGWNDANYLKDYLYLWAYLATSSGNYLYSWNTNAASSGNISYADNVTYWKRGRTTETIWTSWYDIMWWNQITYLDVLYIFKYWNLNWQTTLGAWYTSWSQWWTKCGATNWLSWTILWSTGDMDYWTSSATTPMKFLWLENFWWYQYQWIGWMNSDSSYNLWTATWNFKNSIVSSATSWYEKTASALWSGASSYNWITAVAWDNIAWFMPITTSSSEWVRHDKGILAAGYFGRFGGHWHDGSAAGPFHVRVYYSASYASSDYGSRLMYL